MLFKKLNFGSCSFWGNFNFSRSLQFLGGDYMELSKEIIEFVFTTLILHDLVFIYGLIFYNLFIKEEK